MSQHPKRFHPLLEKSIKSESFAFRVLNTSLNGLYIYDLKLGQNVFINNQYTTLTGYDFEDLQAMDRAQFFELFHPDDQQRVSEHMERLVHNSDDMLEIEYRFKTKDGRWIWCLSRDSIFARDESGSVSQFIGTFFDITDRKKAEEALRQSQEDLNRAQAVGKIGSWRMNVQKNELTWSDESYRICGVPLGSPLTYETFLGIVHPEDREYVDRKWTAALKGEPYDIEHRFVIDGQVKWVRELSELEFDREGILLGGFGICQDITERKRAEETLRAINEELNEYIYALTHNLKAPLRAINNYVNFLFEDLADRCEGETKTYLEGIKDTITLSNKQFEDLETLYRVKSYEVNFTSFKMIELLGEIQSMFKETSHRKLIYSQNWPEFRSESFLLRQILLELINNGFKFNRAEIRCVEIGWQAAEGNGIEIFVSDNGIGIDSQYQQQIFDIFRRLHTESEYEGTGIGLAIVKRAVQKIGGKLRLESTTGKGSTFYVSLPKQILENNQA